MNFNFSWQQSLSIGLYQVLQLLARLDLGAMAMKRYSTFPKAPALLKPHHQIVLCHIKDTRWGGLTLLQSSQCILQIQPTGQGRWKSILPNKLFDITTLSIYLNLWIILLFFYCSCIKIIKFYILTSIVCYHCFQESEPRRKLFFLFQRTLG